MRRILHAFKYCMSIYLSIYIYIYIYISISISIYIYIYIYLDRLPYIKYKYVQHE